MSRPNTSNDDMSEKLAATEAMLRERTEELARLHDQLRMLGDLGRAVGSTLDLDAVLQRIITAAVEMSGADQGTIYDYDEAARHFLPRAMHGMDAEHLDKLRASPIKLGEGAVGHAAAAGEPWEIPDVMVEPAYAGRMREIAMRAGLRAVLAVPMIRGEHIVGGIVVRRKAPGPFGADRISLLQVAAQSTLVLQNERLFDELEAANRLKSQLEARRVTEQLIEALPNPVFFKGTDGRYLGVNSAWESYFGVPRESFVGKTVHDLYPNNPDVADRLHAMDQVLWEEPGSQVYETVITTRDKKRHDVVYYKATFKHPDGGIAGLIGTIVDITRRKQNEKRRNMEHAIARVLSEADTTSEALTRIIQTICESLGWACGAHWRWDAQAQLLRCTETWHIDSPEIAEFVTSAAQTVNEAPAWDGEAPKTKTGGLVRRVWMDGAPVWFRDVTCEPGFRRGASAAKAGLHCAFGFPMLAGSQPLGVMEFYSREIEEPDETLLHVVEAIGRQIGQFRQRREIEAKNREIEKRRAMEHAVTRVLSEADTTPAALTRIIQIFCESLGWACGTYWRWDEQAKLLRYGQTWHIDAREVEEFATSRSIRVIEAPPWEGEAPVTERRGPVFQAWGERAPRWFRDVRSMPGFRLAASAAKADLRSAFAFPVLAGAQPLGILEFYSRDTEEEPDQALLRVVQAIGMQIGQFIRRRESERRSGELETASSNKSQFLANMSHELRTPMNAIIGVSEMLLEDARDLGQTEQVEPLERILRAGQHLLTLINDILDLSKIEAGKMEVYPENFEVAPLLEDVAATIRPIAEKNGNRVTVECAPDVGFMHADVTRVRQALLNLVSNAAKFTEQGTIAISGYRHAVPGSETIMLQVRDSGIGMTAEQIGRLFLDFEQADASTTRKYGGTGLGLAISRRFCRMMGGDIVVQSTLGRGSTFTIQLPAAGAKAGTREPIAERRVAPAIPEISARIRRGAPVLVVDDDETVRYLIQRFLERQGYAVLTAANGIEALARAREAHPAAITLDVMMPDIDGWTVLAAIKGDPTLADIPVVLVSIVDEKQRGYMLGAADYLVKPVDRDRLAAVLRTLCGPRPGRLLLVEDDDTSRGVMRAAVEREGWDVAEAANGRVGLDRVREARPDAIILDLMMPEMDGFEFVAELRKHPEWHDIPVVVVTALDLTEEDRRRLTGEVESVIQKGVYTSDDLLREVSGKLATCVERRKLEPNEIAL